MDYIWVVLLSRYDVRFSCFDMWDIGWWCECDCTPDDEYKNRHEWYNYWYTPVFHSYVSFSNMSAHFFWVYGVWGQTRLRSNCLLQYSILATFAWYAYQQRARMIIENVMVLISLSIFVLILGGDRIFRREHFQRVPVRHADALPILILGYMGDAYRLDRPIWL